MNITKNLTTVNYTKMSNKKNQYIVIHYVGSVSTAKNNSNYFKSVNRNASANYFVDESSIYQVVADTDRAWHCGGELQGKGGHTFYQKCTNSNSIGIEMCLDKANHIADDTIVNTIDLIKSLMKKYDIPESRVIRHYDVTGKLCPSMYVDEKKWKEFKSLLSDKQEECPYKKPTSTVKKGSSKNDVKWVQWHLDKLGYKLPKYGIDGDYGNESENSVTKFQADQKGWTPTGKAGEKTIARLEKLYG